MIRLETPLALLALIPLGYLWWRFARGGNGVRVLRGTILVLIVLILASPVWIAPGGGRSIVFLVDKSLSAGSEALGRTSEIIALALKNRRPEDRITAVAFGENSQALTASDTLVADLRGITLEDSSDLHGGLEMAASMCATGKGRILIVSDGAYTGLNPLDIAPELARRGLIVDYLPLEREFQNDAAITAIEVPDRVRVNEPFEVGFNVRSPAETPVTIKVETPDGMFEQQAKLQSGDNRFTFLHRISNPGLSPVRISAIVQGDARTENNHAMTVTTADGPAEILLVNQTGQPDNLSRAIEGTGIAVRIWDRSFPLTSANLAHFQAVVMENVALSSVSEMADAALKNYVLEFGGGLLVTGGQSSFAAGGYYKSNLEDVLPVAMERKGEYRRARVAMSVVLDRSGSMAIPVDNRGTQKMHLADRAAAEAISLLDDKDEAAVFGVDSAAHAVVRRTKIGGNRDEIRKKILSIESEGGGIFVYEGLKAGMAEIAKSDAPTKHVVLFADAADSEEPGDYKKLVTAWVKAGGSVSIIGLGTEKDCDADLLKDIAKIGGGRAFFTSDARSLARVFCQDAMQVARNTFINEKTSATVTPELTRIGRLNVSSFPDIGGYNLCYSKPGAATAIVTKDENKAPVLAMHQRGLGKCAALTCEADGQYTGQLRDWENYRVLFESLTRWLRKKNEDNAMFGTVVRHGRTGIVHLELEPETAEKFLGATALIIPPDEAKPFEIPLQWDGPYSLSGSFRLAQNGAYHGVIVSRNGGHISLPAVILPYSPEFEPVPKGAGTSVLRQLSEATGGEQFQHVDDLLVKSENMASGAAAKHLSPFIAIVALCLVMSDIITRRGLWNFLLPTQKIANAAGSTGSVFASAYDYARTKIARKEKLTVKQTDSDTTTEKPEKPASPPPKPESKSAEDLLRQAKRRSRGGRE